MPRHSKLVLAGLTATLLLAFSVGSASANRLSINQPRFRIAWSSLEFMTALATTVKCPVTLEGSFHSQTFAKVDSELLGYISRAAVGTCPRGSAIVLQETLPWHIAYKAFRGTLPVIVELIFYVAGLSFRLTPETGIPCLVRSTVAQSANFFMRLVREGGGRLNITEFAAVEATIIPCTGFGTPETSLRGGGPFFRLGTTNTDVLLFLI